MKARLAELSLDCIATSDLGVALSLPALSEERALFALDLSLGSCRGLQPARDLAAQLDVELQANLMNVDASTRDPAALVAAWVDAEGRGDQLVAQTAQFAGVLAHELNRRQPASLLIVCARPACFPIAEEDRLFLWFLLNALRGGPVACIGLSEQPEALAAQLPWLKPRLLPAPEGGQRPADPGTPVDDPMVWVPGLVPARLLIALSELGHGTAVACLQLAGDLVLVDPRCRPREPCSPPHPDAETLEVVRQFPEIHASWVALGLGPDPSDLQPLAATAWSIAGQGGVSLAESVLTRLVEWARGLRLPCYGALLKDLQSLRISAQRYASAAAQSADFGLLGEAEVRDLLYTVGWGRALSGDPAGSMEAFSKAGPPSLVAVAGPIDLYLCNIYALALFRNRAHDKALALEKGIQRKLALAGPGNWHLKYINHFNLSRLYRAAGDLPSERLELEGVMKTTDGLLTDVDQIYLNLTWASLEARAGNVFEALRHTWRACVHWLACETPEALGWRTSLLLFSRSVRLQPGETVEVTKALQALLARRAAEAGCAVAPVRDVAPTFVNVCQVPEATIRASSVVSAGELGILLGSTAPSEGPLDSGRHGGLAQAVHALFAQHSGVDVSQVSTWLVDDEFGQSIPFGPEGVRRLTLRWAPRSSVGWHAPADDVAAASFDLVRGPGVDAIEVLQDGRIQCRFKRYRAGQFVARSLEPVVRRLLAGDRLPLEEALALRYDDELDVTENRLNLLRRLELSRVAVLR